ncbi:Pisatin demethylase [Fonsecaea pedrosoi]|nr:Pisatin demethylase [Fonsecaea pedrosoi]
MASTDRLIEREIAAAAMGVFHRYDGGIRIQIYIPSLSRHIQPRNIVLIAVLLLAITWIARRIFRRDLRSIPGPFLASLSNFYRLAMVLRGQSQWETIALHKKHGHYLRLGPNFVSVSDPEALPIIYGIAKGFRKSDFYTALDPVSNGRLMQSMFATQSDEWHRIQRKPIAHAYAMSTLVSYEPLVDSTTGILMDVVGKRFAATGQTCNLAQWLQWYAFDVMGEITFSERFGFLEQGRDIGDICQGIHHHFTYGAPVGQIPWIDIFLRRNPLRPKREVSDPMVAFTADAIGKRLQSSNDVEQYHDFLSRFLNADVGPDSDKDAHFRNVLSWSVNNVGAGSDTTGISLTAVFYYLLTNPHSFQVLLEEIRSTRFASHKAVSWKEAQSMPYLQACIKEALRLHPAVGMPLERVVPEGGVSLGGHWLKGGTVVGVNAWVVHRNKDVFGPDAEVWSPERWIKADTEQLKAMERATLTFGSGSRTCLGKNISLLEMSKLVPQLLRSYEITLATPGEEWKTQNFWFVKPDALNVRFKAIQHD